MTINVKDIIEKCNSLPPLPQAVQRLYQMSGDMNSEVKDMANIINKDPALTSKLLRLVNSAFYGLSQKISTVSHGIMIIGFKGIRNMALGLSVMKMGSNVQDDKSSLTIKEFWRHSLATATASRILATKLNMKEPEEAFVAGLIHDIGKLIFMEHYSNYYNDILNKAKEVQKELSAIEKIVFGLDHAYLGGIIASQWKLPKILSNALEKHHNPNYSSSEKRDEDKMVYVVRAGNNIAKISQMGWSGNPKVDENLVHETEQIKITSKDMRDIITKLNEEIKKSEILLQLNKD